MITDSKNWEENENWECFLCAHEFPFSVVAFGWLADYHPICRKCTTKIIMEKDNIHRKRLTTLFSSQCYLTDFAF